MHNITKNFCQHFSSEKPEGEEAAEGEQVEDDSAKEMTLDEYKAMQASGRTKTSFNIRRAGEGVDDQQWKKTYALSSKKKHDSDEEEESEEEEEVSD